MSSWFQDINRELSRIRKGTIAPVYFIYGGDEFLADQVVQSLRRAFKDKFGNTDFTHLHANEVTASALQNALYTQSLFQNHQITWIYEIKSLIPSARKVLVKYLVAPDENNVVLLSLAKFDKKNSFVQEIIEHAVTLYTNTPFENEIPQWIEDTFRERNRSIEPSAIRRLMQLTGTQLFDLANEIDKLDIFLEPGKKVDENDIKQIAGVVRSFSIDDLLTAIGQKNGRKAIIVIRNLVEQGIHDTRIIIPFFHFFWNMQLLRNDRSSSDADLMKWLRIYKPKEIAIQKNLAMQFSADQCRAGIKAAVAADMRLKTSQTDSLTNLIIMIKAVVN